MAETLFRAERVKYLFIYALWLSAILPLSLPPFRTIILTHSYRISHIPESIFSTAYLHPSARFLIQKSFTAYADFFITLPALPSPTSHRRSSSLLLSPTWHNTLSLTFYPSEQILGIDEGTQAQTSVGGKWGWFKASVGLREHGEHKQIKWRTKAQSTWK